MKRSTLFACKVGFITLLSFITIIGSFSDIPPTQWLNHTFLGMAFRLYFEMNFPLWFAFALTSLVFLLIFYVGYHLSKPLFEYLDFNK